MIKALDPLAVDKNNIWFCPEATSHYWLPLLPQLEQLGYQLYVINLIQSDLLHNLNVRKTKTDANGALLLANMMQLGYTTETKLVEKTILKLQTLSCSSLDFVHQASSLKNQMLGILNESFSNTPAG